MTSYLRELELRRYKAYWEKDDTVFRFGNQGVLSSDKKCVLPVQIFGTQGELHVHVVPGACPLLLSEETLKTLDITMHFGSGKIDVGATNSYGMALEYHESGHPVLRLLPDARWQASSSSREENSASDQRYGRYDQRHDYSDNSQDPWMTWYTDDWQAEAHLTNVKRGVKKRLKNLTNTVYETIAETSPLQCRPLKLLEIFSWSMTLSEIGFEHGWDVLEPIDSVNGWDLRLRSVQNRVIKYINRERPDLVILAWPCSASSSMQNLNIRSEAANRRLSQRRKEDEVFIRFALRVVRKQLARGGHVLVENPLALRAWQMYPGRMLKKLLYPFKLHMCAYGLRDPLSGAFLQKPTLYLCSDLSVAEAPSKSCRRDHHHLPIRGHPLSAIAGGYTWEFSNAVLQNYERGISQEPDWQREQFAFPVDTKGSPRLRRAGGRPEGATTLPCGRRAEQLPPVFL